MKFTPEELKEIQDFIAGDVRFRGMSIRDAEELAWHLLYKWRDDALNFLGDMKHDATMVIDRFTKK